MKINGKHELLPQIARKALLLAALLALVLSVATFSSAQSTWTTAPIQNAKPTATPATTTQALTAPERPAVLSNKAPSSPEEKPTAKGQHEGINVHGYWVIDVRNPDGKLAKHLEFENQLCTSFVDPTSGGTVPAGDSTLAAVLSGSGAPGAWSIVFGTPELIQLPPGGPGGGGFVPGPNCAIHSQFSLAQSGVQGGSAVLGTITGSAAGAPPPTQVAPFALGCSGNCFPSLTVSSPPNISLSGQFTVPAGNPVNISAVGTDLFTCSSGQVTKPFGNGTPAGPQSCQNAGNAYGQNAGKVVGVVPGFECSAHVDFANASGNTFAYVIDECLTGLVPGSIIMPTYQVAGQFGRSPFSGVVLNGTNGVPGPFTASPGQTVAVNWTLSFQ